MKKTILLIALFAFGCNVYAQNNFATTGDSYIAASAATNSLTFGNTATGIAMYNTSSMTSNYERLLEQLQSNVFTLGTYVTGTGTARPLKMGVQIAVGTATLTGTFARTFTVNPYVGTSAGFFDFYGSPSNGGNVMTLNGALSGTGTVNMMSVQPTVNLSGSAGYVGMLIDPYEQGVGTGPSLLIDAGTNSAATGGGTHTQYFTVNHAGNTYIAGTAGIATTYIPAGYKMAVNGNIMALAITVQPRTQWPDYVFNKTYRLPTLDAVQAYIKKNGHLEEMPSAEQIKNNGQDLGEVNRTLVKKMEEMTLYMIELNKLLKKQQREIDKLKRKTLTH